MFSYYRIRKIIRILRTTYSIYNLLRMELNSKQILSIGKNFLIIVFLYFVTLRKRTKSFHCNIQSNVFAHSQEYFQIVLHSFEIQRRLSHASAFLPIAQFGNFFLAGDLEIENFYHEKLSELFHFVKQIQSRMNFVLVKDLRKFYRHESPIYNLWKVYRTKSHRQRRLYVPSFAVIFFFKFFISNKFI